MEVRAAAAALLTLLLAGCADARSVPGVATGEPVRVDESQLVSSTEGGIQGVTVDQSLAPVANATIVLQNGTNDEGQLAEMHTDAQGRFAFGRLGVQAYRISAKAAGFAPMTKLVQVSAGELSRVTLTLGAVASSQPYIELLIKNGVTGCSVTAVWLVLGLPCGTAFPGTYQKTFKVTIPEDWAYAAIETAWRTRDAIWIYAQLDNGSCINPGHPCPGNAKGTSPLRFDAAPDSGLNTSKYQFGSIKYPPAGKGFDLWLQVSDFGLFYDEINHNAKAVCDLNGYCGGVGTTVQIRFSIYLSIFHHAAPEAPQKYSAVPDT
jgi:hypothetical protein